MQSIVTGSSGFIGSRLSYLLEKEGCDVVGVSRHMQSRERDVKCDLEKDCLKEENFKSHQLNVKNSSLRKQCQFFWLLTLHHLGWLQYQFFYEYYKCT